MGSKFLFKSTKQVYKHVSKKSGATTSGTKNNTKIPSREAGGSNPFEALRAVENDDVLCANGGSSMRVETDVDAGKKAHAKPIQSLLSMPNNVTLVSKVQLAHEQLVEVESGGRAYTSIEKDDYDDNLYADDDDCEDLTKENLAICDVFDIKIRGHARRL
ncbi:hypothetical protein Tco_1209795 [Tanacetum coccineum]